MNSVTGDFDVVIQVREPVLNQIARAMHASGMVTNQWASCVEGQRLDLLVGAPQVSLQAPSPGDTASRANLLSRVLFQMRPISDPGGAGLTGTADVTARGAYQATAPDPANPETASIHLDWKGTGPGDITFSAVAGPAADQVRNVILAQLRSAASSIPLAAAATALPGLSAAPAIRFVPAPRGNLASLGLDYGVGPAGQPQQITADFTGRNDWAMALSREYALQKIRQEMPGLPLLLDSSDICVFDVFGYCLVSVRQQVYLDSLDADLTAGDIQLAGVARLHYEPVGADIRANLSVLVRTGIENGVVTAVPEHTSIHFDEPLATVLTGLGLDGRLAGAAQEMLQKALSPEKISPYVSGVRSLLLNGLQALGKIVQLNVTPQIDTITVRPEGIIIGGTVSVADTSRPPSAHFMVLRGTGHPARRLFHAAQSRAPGNTIRELGWDFGDGQWVRRSGVDLRLVEQHDYNPGRYRPLLWITDDAGQTATYSEAVMSVGLMDLRGDQWIFTGRAKPFEATFRAEEDGQPLEDVTITASAPGWQVQQITGADGRATLTLDPERFMPLAAPAVDPTGEWFLTGSVQIQASKAEYQAESRTLYLADAQLRLTGQWDLPRETITGQLIPPRVSPPQAAVPIMQLAITAQFWVHEHGAPVAGATVTATGKDGWQTQRSTGEDGSATLILPCDNFETVFRKEPTYGQKPTEVLITRSMVVEASKFGARSDVLFVYLGKPVPQPPSLPEWRRRAEDLRSRMKVWYERQSPFDTHEVADRAQVAPVREEAIDLGLAIDVLQQIIDVSESRSGLLSAGDLAGSQAEGDNLTKVISARLNDAISHMESRFHVLEEATKHTAGPAFAVSGTHPASEPTAAPRWQPVTRAVHEEWSEQARGLQQAAALIAQLSPGGKALQAELNRELKMLGGLTLLAERSSVAPAIARLLGLEPDDAPRAVARRAQILLHTLRQGFAAFLADALTAPR